MFVSYSFNKDSNPAHKIKYVFEGWQIVTTVTIAYMIWILTHHPTLPCFHSSSVLLISLHIAKPSSYLGIFVVFFFSPEGACSPTEAHVYMACSLNSFSSSLKCHYKRFLWLHKIKIVCDSLCLTLTYFFVSFIAKRCCPCIFALV